MATEGDDETRDIEGTSDESSAGTDFDFEKNPAICFHYIKNNNFRTLRVDGAIGGVTATNKVSMALWCERLPIPKLHVRRIDKGGTLGDEITELRDTKTGLVREVEVVALLEPVTALQISNWLRDKAQEALDNLGLKIRVEEATEEDNKDE